mgnify:FL=1
MRRGIDNKNILDRKEHLEQIERWANYVKAHKDWKTEHTKFIDAQFQIANRFYKKLTETSEGREKIKRLRELKMGRKSNL